MQLILAGGGAADDPEGAEILDEVRERLVTTLMFMSFSCPPMHIGRSTPFSVWLISLFRNRPAKASG